ncbi:MAG: hypothetical protein Q7R93_04055 [bacterium]|nr:hypothetical protein [bacterium]
MTASYRKKITSLVACFLLVTPLSVHAIFDFGGRVLNVPGTHASEMFLATSPIFPPVGVDTFWDAGQGTCLNGVQEVDQLQALGVPQPPILLQFVGQYTFAVGPATHPGQQILGKYFPGMVCMMNFVVWLICGFEPCPVVFPLPLFFAPLIIFNGSSPI